jgi:probable rRNA maturation factor
MREILVNDMQNRLKGTKRLVARVLRRVLRAEGIRAYALSVALVDDARMRALNRRFLGRRGTTDVMSFPLSGPGDRLLAGEIVASAERALAVARDRRADPRGELLLYVVHGCLHLTGYDDRTAARARDMHDRENQLLAEFGYAEAYGSGRRRRKPTRKDT